jgi:hypothetical protein
MPGSVASGTPFITMHGPMNVKNSVAVFCVPADKTLKPVVTVNHLARLI